MLVEYIGDDTTAFNDPVQGEALSTTMYDDGADVIYHAAGASGAGLFNAAVEADEVAIGVDSDQYLTASPEQQPWILTSMLKRVDTAVYDAIEAVGDDTFGGQRGVRHGRGRRRLLAGEHGAADRRTSSSSSTSSRSRSSTAPITVPDTPA